MLARTHSISAITRHRPSICCTTHPRPQARGPTQAAGTANVGASGKAVRDASATDEPERAPSNLRVGGPLDRFAAEIGERAPSLWLPTCPPTDDDAATGAVLRYAFELSSSTDATVDIHDAGCVAVQTLGGPLPIGRASGGAPVPLISVGLASTDDVTVELPWPDAPTRVLSLEWYAGPLEAESTLIVVQRVDGLWRVVHVQLVWIS